MSCNPITSGVEKEGSAVKDFAELPTQSWTSCDDVAINLKSNEANVENIAVLDVMNATSNSNDAVSKLVKIWENKNAQRALRGAGLSAMAVSLAACGGSSSTSTSSSDTSDTTTTTPVTGSSFTLTTGTDGVTGTDGADTISGARDDTIQTLNSSDTISAGGGSDTLNAVLNAGTIAPTLTSVDNITVSAVGAATLDMDNATGYELLTNSASTAAMIFDDIASIAGVKIVNTSQATTFTFKDAAVAGATTVTLTLEDVGGGIITLGGETDADGDIETINIVSNGSANTTGDIAFGADATTVTVTGAGDLDINAGAEFAKIATFNASAATGDIDVTFADRASTSDSFDVTATFGSGNDLVDITNWAAADFDNITVDLGNGNDTLVDTKATRDGDTGSSYDGGLGTDTLRIDGAMTAAEEALYSGFEILELAGVSSGDAAQDMDNADGMNIVHIFSVGDATADLTLSDAANGLAVHLNGAALASVDAEGSGTGVGSDEDMDTLTVNLKTDTAADTLDLYFDAETADVNLETFAPDANYETVTIHSLGTTSSNVLQTVSTSLNNLTIVGSTDFTLLSTGSLTGVVDASAFTGDLTATTGTGALTLTGGAGDDTLTSGVATASQTINGGAGDDTITAGAIVNSADAATIFYWNGGDGNDTIDVSAVVGSGGASGDDVFNYVDGGAGIDIITLSGDADVGERVISTATTVADMDIAKAYDSGGDSFDYNGSLNNGSVTAIASADVSSATTLSGAITSNADAVVYIQTNDITASGDAETALDAIIAASNSEVILTQAAAFEAALAVELGTITGLDANLGADEYVLISVSDGTDTAVLRVNNYDTSVANTLTADEMELIAVFSTEELVAGDFI